MITLYQMPVSHYCEKVRWALAYKRLPYRTKNLLPGLHARPVKKMTGQTAVPVLKDGCQILANSSDIISFLDDEYPRFSLTPDDSDLALQAKEWEAWADAEIAVNVRILAYYHLLDRPDLLKPMFCDRGPWYGRFYIDLTYEKVAAALRQGLQLNEQRVEKAKEALKLAIIKLKPYVESNSRLLGSDFSRADLAVAALLAPLFQPNKYDLMWPESMPVDFQRDVAEFESVKAWVLDTYQRYR
ncbi:glutathione S-transferase family protein [Agaribacterium sp. ZY112]|uniref:glutathione S-transferase family protein n=1 Tax=Agaribacterium sp. ZY112 TaxID=3233574 RepID=UPI0035266634